MYEEEIKKLLTSKKLLIGRDEVMKNLRKGLVHKAYVASNCPNDLLTDLRNYSKITSFELLETNVPNDDLGTVCKKPFSIAVIGVLK
jgi:large subunit ribosomal protein L30e